MSRRCSLRFQFVLSLFQRLNPLCQRQIAITQKLSLRVGKFSGFACGCESEYCRRG
jgi:hypothetical protein